MIELEPETTSPNDRDYDSEDEIDHGLLHHRALQPISTTIDEIKDKPVVVPWKGSREWDLGPTTNPNQLPLPRSRPGTPRVDSGLFERPQGSTSTAAVPLNEQADGKKGVDGKEKEEEEEDEDGEVLCRICFMGAEEEVDLGRLISPCLCRGSMRVSRGGASLTFTTRAFGVEVDVDYSTISILSCESAGYDRERDPNDYAWTPPTCPFDRQHPLHDQSITRSPASLVSSTCTVSPPECQTDPIADTSSVIVSFLISFCYVLERLFSGSSSLI